MESDSLIGYDFLMSASLTDVAHRLAGVAEQPEDRVLQKVLRNVDGVRDLKRIAVTCGISEDAVLIAAEDLEHEGYIELESQSKIDFHPGQRRRGRSSGMYSQVTPSERPRRASQPTAHALAPERQSEIDSAFNRLETATHYTLLGVSEDAPKGEIRDAYFRLSKRFHPDSVFGMELGDYKPKMEAVFQRLTDAYDTLGRSKRRERYNRELGITAKPKSDPLSERTTNVHRPLSQRGVPSEAPTAKFKRLTDDEKRARRQLHTRKLLAVTQQGEGRYRLSSRPSVAAVEAPAPTPSAAPVRTTASSPSGPRKITDATRALAQSLQETAQTTGGVSRVEAYVENARVSANDGDFRGAVNSIRLAMNAAPEREDIRALFADYNSRLQSVVAETARERALKAERSNDWSRAAAAWIECCDAAPDDVEAHLRAVKAGLEADIGLPDCKRLSQRAVELDPTNAEARRWLAKVFIAAGMTLNAKRELKKALTLDPSDKISEDMLRTLK